MKKGLIGKTIAIICICVIVLLGALNIRTSNSVDCKDCNGYGYTHALPCGDCSGTGLVEGKDCSTCEKSGTTTTMGLADDPSISEYKSACITCNSEGKTAPESIYHSTILALLPPLIAIALALITKEVYS